MPDSHERVTSQDCLTRRNAHFADSPLILIPLQIISRLGRGGDSERRSRHVQENFNRFIRRADPGFCFEFLSHNHSPSCEALLSSTPDNAPRKQFGRRTYLLAERGEYASRHPAPRTMGRRLLIEVIVLWPGATAPGFCVIAMRDCACVTPRQRYSGRPKTCYPLGLTLGREC